MLANYKKIWSKEVWDKRTLSLVTLLLLLLIFIPVFSVSAQVYERKLVNVYFPSDGDQLDVESRNIIRSALLELNAYIIKEIFVEGHTDSDASQLYNISLAARRAEHTREYLLTQGVRSDMIKLESFGESKPVGKSKARNRRVQLTIIYEVNPFQEEQTVPVKRGEARFVKVATFHANTRKPLTCTYVLEKNNHNKFASTDSRATCYFDRSSYGTHFSLTFSKDGFLNETLNLDTRDFHNAGDTLYVPVYLKPVEVIQKLRFDHIYFFTDTDNFKPESKPELEKLVKMLKDFPGLYIEIQGHMNYSETKQANVFQRIYNHDLSHRRARAVYNYLIEKGISKERLTYKGLSNFRMIYPNPKTSKEADQNKRVEVWTLQVVADRSNGRPQGN